MLHGDTGKCPHCGVGVRFEATNLLDDRDSNYGSVDPLILFTASAWNIRLSTAGCPDCGRPIVWLVAEVDPTGNTETIDSLAWPVGGQRPIPEEVTQNAADLAADFKEAVAVLPWSKKASAALSRRCLQFILREKGGANKHNLVDQIDEVLDALPSELAKNVDAIRQVGNFAAHPLKSTSSGQIVEVEEGEAEWLLDVLEELFDFYYVAPIKAGKRRAALNAKLTSLGKPTLKKPQKGSTKGSA